MATARSYELGNGIEIHITPERKVLHIIDSHPPEELDITETTLGQFIAETGSEIPERTAAVVVVATLTKFSGLLLNPGRLPVFKIQVEYGSVFATT
jgi:hypothetical protein